MERCPKTFYLKNDGDFHRSKHSQLLSQPPPFTPHPCPATELSVTTALHFLGCHVNEVSIYMCLPSFS
jgi:hypothetical protein